MQKMGYGRWLCVLVTRWFPRAWMSCVLSRPFVPRQTEASLSLHVFFIHTGPFRATTSITKHNPLIEVKSMQDPKFWMENGVTTANFRNYFSSCESLGMSENTGELDGTPYSHNGYWYIGRSTLKCGLASLERQLSLHFFLWTFCDLFLKAQVCKELQIQGRHKAPCSDSLLPALLKDFVNELQGLTLRADPFLEREVTVVPTNKHDSHWIINLIPTASKLLVAVILHRLYNMHKEHNREEQVGSRPGRRCIDSNSH